MSNSSLQSERRSARKQEKAYQRTDPTLMSQPSLESPEPTDRPPSGYTRQGSGQSRQSSGLSRQSSQEATPTSHRRTAPDSDSERPGRSSRQNSSEGGRRHLNSQSSSGSLRNGDPVPVNIQDETVEVSEDGGRKDSRGHRRQDSYRSEMSLPPRLLVVSNKIKNAMIMQTAIMGNVTFVQYKYDSATLDGILASIAQHLGTKKVESIALIFHSSGSCINLSGKDDKFVTKENILETASIRNFFSMLASNHIDDTWVNARIDFLACNAGQNVDGGLIAREIETIVGVPVGISKDVVGADIPMERIGEESSKPLYVGELYFRMDRLRSFSGQNPQSLAGFEKIRTVGKGAYGTAVLYRKKDDDSLVILKEINLHDLNASERQLALNEVKVLAMLDHPNIISYYDSFEEDGIVMIEMEYADGGTLAQHLSLVAQQDKPLEEKEILTMFSQMVAAIKYIHEHNILHRDLKTANIFLTKEGVVKVGDFGISKLMTTTQQGANTVLGTPYYISPEMCEGKAYNDKSDIWALGCILYEMACLQKTFEGSNLPALVNKIMKGQFAPVKGNYSQEFKDIILAMLQREPEYRPSASELWTNKLPELMLRYEEPVTDYEDDVVTSTDHVSGRKRKTRSVLYYFEMSKMALTAISLSSKVKIRAVAVGNDHVIAVTMERMVYTWGEGGKGQLGHGSLESVATPTCVEALKGKSIVRACCGDGFSLFASDNGIVMTCGDGTFGCLGHGDWCSTSRPRLIEALLSVDVVSIGCGPHHVIAVGTDGEVYSWGRGTDGRLGLGTEESHCQPVEVKFSEKVCVRDIFCGIDGSMLLTDVGSVLACGNNEYNKLGLNQRQGFLMAMRSIFNKTEVAGEKDFTVVRVLARHRVVDVSLGRFHSAIVVEPGHVYTFGRNSEGQLGNGNTKQPNAPFAIKIFQGKPAFRVQCGDIYTVAGTTDNDLLFWGTKFKLPQKYEDVRGVSGCSTRNDLRVESASGGSGSSRAHSRQPSASSVCSIKEADSRESSGVASTPDTGENPLGPGGQGDSPHPPGGLLSPPGPDRQLSNDSVFSSGDSGFRPLSSTPRRSVASASEKPSLSREVSVVSKEDAELITQPTPLLRMDSSGTHSTAGDTVTLSKFYCHGENLFIQVETTAPPPKRRARKKRFSRRRLSSMGSNTELPESQQRMSASSRDGGDEYSSEASELETQATKLKTWAHANYHNMSRTSLQSYKGSTGASIPAWLRKELANSEMDLVEDGNEPDDTSDHSEDDESSPLPESSMSSIKINTNLRQGTPLRRGPAEVDARPKVPSRHSSPHKKHYSPEKDHVSVPNSSTESGIEINAADALSSSSSSEVMASALMAAKQQEQGAVGGSTKGVASAPKRVVAPAPYMSKGGPNQSQKPLTRIRAQGKTRRSDPKEAAGVIKAVEAEVKLKQESIEHLQTELEKLREEKQRTEERLHDMEEEQRKQAELIRVEAEKKAVAKESELKSEIINLRQELRQQSSQLNENYNVVISLQEQLVKVQTEQMRISAREQQKPPDPRQSVQKESRICVVS